MEPNSTYGQPVPQHTSSPCPQYMAGVWVLVATILLTLHQATSAPIVYTRWGRIQGLDSVGVSGLSYSSYLGIPYALPPIGQRRFSKPVAHPGFGEDQVFNATTPGDQCLQLPSTSISDVATSEDCLTLNVYVPVSPSGGKWRSVVFHCFLYCFSFIYAIKNAFCSSKQGLFQVIVVRVLVVVVVVSLFPGIPGTVLLPLQHWGDHPQPGGSPLGG